MTVPGVPPEVEAAARRRSQARADRDWATADRLRAGIEAAGWRVIDSGVRFRLEPLSPASVEVGGEIRYGRSEDVPSLLDQPEVGLASVIVVASADADETRGCLEALDRQVPAGVDVVLVLDGLGEAGATPPRVSISVETVRTSAPLGHGAALNIGIRRSRAPVVVVVDPSIALAADLVTPLVEALRDPSVAIAGPVGLVSPDLRRFDEIVAADEPVDAAAIQGSMIAFRRADAVARGPIDEGFRFAPYLDVWWSLLLRDEGEELPPRRAVVVPWPGVARSEPAAWRFRGARPEERERRSKRSFYRMSDRFRTRVDLAVPGPADGLANGKAPRRIAGGTMRPREAPSGKT